MTDRFLIVRLEADLHVSRKNGIMHNIFGLPGVVSVTDLAAITQETLDAILMAPEPPPIELPLQAGLWEGGAA